MPALHLRSPGVAWVALAVLLVGGALFAPALVGAHTIDWQPARWGAEPWRWWTAAFVHLSPLHLWGNLAATALIAAFGVSGAMPPRAAGAWFAAWPLTHLGLLSMPELRHYGGLSGLLHAGVAVAAVQLAVSRTGLQRWIGVATLVAVAAKVLSETPWRAAVQVSPQWDIPVAPIAHLTGAVAGLLCGLAAAALEVRSRRA